MHPILQQYGPSSRALPTRTARVQRRTFCPVQAQAPARSPAAVDMQCGLVRQQMGSLCKQRLSKPASQERMEFLKKDLIHLFDDQGIDETQYEPVVTFLDPITKYSSVQGYMFNIKMLKSAFDPKFELHDIKQTAEYDIKQTAEYDITTRWTMTMTFTPASKLGLSRWWKPTLIFTGTSIYGFNPASGKINRHIDTWDSINNQQFFSLEAFGDFWKQLGQTFVTPNLETPGYTVLRRSASYQVRQYEPFWVAETALDYTDQQQQQSSGVTISPASIGVAAFKALVGYLSGQNEAQQQIAMTTPVFTNNEGAMQFVVGGKATKEASGVPQPTASNMACKQQPGVCYATATFNGVATPRRCKEVEEQLRGQLLADGLQPEGAIWWLARYNDPSVKPMFRRNEVLIPLSSFNLWG